LKSLGLKQVVDNEMPREKTGAKRDEVLRRMLKTPPKPHLERARSKSRRHKPTKTKPSR
jgi:hypothetical protein